MLKATYQILFFKKFFLMPTEESGSWLLFKIIIL